MKAFHVAVKSDVTGIVIIWVRCGMYVVVVQRKDVGERWGMGGRYSEVGLGTLDAGGVRFYVAGGMLIVGDSVEGGRWEVGLGAWHIRGRMCGMSKHGKIVDFASARVNPGIYGGRSDMISAPHSSAWGEASRRRNWFYKVANLRI